MGGRIFLDVTRTAGTRQHTGIPKVVRGLYRALRSGGAREGLEVVPVVLTGEGAIPLPDLAPHPHERPASGQRRTATRALERIRGVAEDALRRGRAALAARREESAVARALLYAGERALSTARWVSVQGAARRSVVKFRPGDVLLLADLTWMTEPWSSIAAARSGGARVAAIWYDLVPLQHPEFFDADLSGQFRKCLERLVGEADLIVAISRSVRDEIDAYCAARGIVAPRLAHAWPGVGIAPAPSRPRPDLAEILAAPTIVQVATLEPRKGQAILLDACEVLWSRGIACNCLFVGRIGWGVDMLVQRLRTHPQRGRRLFHVGDASDEDVSFVLSRACAMAYPSRAEGLGLPIIEAELAGCPAVCTDIPVFREIAGPFTVLVREREGRAFAEALAPLLEASNPARRAAIAATRVGLGDEDYARSLLEIFRAEGVLPRPTSLRTPPSRGIGDSGPSLAPGPEATDAAAPHPDRRED